MALHFVGFGDANSKAKLEQEQMNQFNQTLGNISNQAVNRRQQDIENALRQKQQGQSDFLFQREYGQQPNGQQLDQNMAPNIPGSLSLFQGNQSSSRGVLDHWDQAYPHLSSMGQSRADTRESLANRASEADIYKTTQEGNYYSKRDPYAEMNFKHGKKEDQFYQKEWDKIVKESDPLTSTSRSGLGMAARADFNANRALTTLSKGMVTNQEAGNVMADIASIYQGGSATQYGMTHQGYTTLYGKIQGALQSLTGSPQDALPDDIKARLIGVLTEMKATNKAVIRQQLDHIEKAQPNVIGRYKDEWQNIRGNLEGGVAGGPEIKPTGGATHRWNPQTNSVEPIQ